MKRRPIVRTAEEIVEDLERRAKNLDGKAYAGSATQVMRAVIEWAKTPPEDDNDS
jgi:hypothetical protein